MDFKVTLVAVLATLGSAKEATYELVLSDENIFAACPDAPPGTLDIHGLFDLSEFSASLEENGTVMSGNMSLIWDIQPQDRVKVVIKLLYFDRGTWTPTVFTVTSHDFCKSMYDSKQPWYKLWTGHVINVEDVRDKCVSPGTKLILDTYLMRPTKVADSFREGLYKIHVTIKAFDAVGTERPVSICFDVIGYLQKKEVSNI